MGKQGADFIDQSRRGHFVGVQIEKPRLRALGLGKPLLRAVSLPVMVQGPRPMGPGHGDRVVLRT